MTEKELINLTITTVSAFAERACLGRINICWKQETVAVVLQDTEMIEGKKVDELVGWLDSPATIRRIWLVNERNP